MLLAQIARGRRDDGSLGDDQFPPGLNRKPNVLFTDEIEWRLVWVSLATRNGSASI